MNMNCQNMTEQYSLGLESWSPGSRLRPPMINLKSFGDVGASIVLFIIGPSAWGIVVRKKRMHLLKRKQHRAFLMPPDGNC